MSKTISPNNREVIYAVGLTNHPETLLSTNGSLDVHITGGTSETQYAELTTTSPGTGNLSLARFQSAPPSLTDGQMYALQLDSSGNLKVTGSISVGGTTDNSAFTAGSSTGTPTMGFYHSVIDTVTDGRAAAVGITSKRALLVNLQTATGAETGIAGLPLQVSLANTGANTSKLLVTADPITFASAQSVNATLSAETTKVIGTVRTADGSGNLYTSNSSTYTAKFGQDANLLGTLGTAFSTAGKVDVKGADGDVFVRQATGTNLHTVIDSGTITTVTTLTGITNALPAGTNLIGHVITDSGSTTAVTGTVATAEVAPTTVLNGKKVVTTAGTRVTLAASTACKSVTIKALSTNTGTIYVGDTSVASTNGLQLLAGESVSLDIANLTTVNLDCSVNGEGVTYLGVN